MPAPTFLDRVRFTVTAASCSQLNRAKHTPRFEKLPKNVRAKVLCKDVQGVLFDLNVLLKYAARL